MLNNIDSNNTVDFANSLKLAVFDYVAKSEILLSSFVDFLNQQPEGVDVSAYADLYNRQKGCISSLTISASNIDTILAQMTDNEAMINRALSGVYTNAPVVENNNVVQEQETVDYVPDEVAPQMTVDQADVSVPDYSVVEESANVDTSTVGEVIPEETVNESVDVHTDLETNEVSNESNDIGVETSVIPEVTEDVISTESAVTNDEVVTESVIPEENDVISTEEVLKLKMRLLQLM